MSVSSLFKSRFGGKFNDGATIRSQSTLGRDKHMRARIAAEMVQDRPLKLAASPPPIREELIGRGVVWLKPPSTRFPGRWMPIRDGTQSVLTEPGTGELCMQTHYPLYFVLGRDSPKLAGEARTIYFEVRWQKRGPPDEENRTPNLHLGFVAKPYSQWRMPGFERGSIAVNCDDGNLLVNDEFSSQEFAKPFKVGDTVGLGLRYWPKAAGTKGPDTELEGELFLTRNGRLDKTWPLRDLAGTGLAGDHDLHAAVGSLGENSYLTMFAQNDWKFGMRKLPEPKPNTPLEAISE